nr:unknown [Cytobacillus firmus]
MNLNKMLSNQFDSVVLNVKKTSELVDCSGASVFIIHNNNICYRRILGKHSQANNARSIQEDTQFHVASVRKSYIGYAVAYAVQQGLISTDDPITKYLSINSPILQKTTIRHLLTHTHGLKMVNGKLQQEFTSGESWAYRGIGIELLTQIVKITTGQSVAEIVDQVFKSLEFKETGWYGALNEKLVEVIRKPGDPNWYTSKSTDGDKMNMYVSTRELAKWGYFHLKEGLINGKQIAPSEIFNLVTSIQSPNTINEEHPTTGFLWFVQDLPTRRSEIGEYLPKGSFQILGYTGVTLLIVPQHNLVAVRAFNSFGSPEGFNYLADVRKFGDTIMTCLLS